MVASISIKRFLLESSEPASTTMNLHPKHTQATHTSSSSSSSSSPPPSSKSKRKKFGAEAHEVPSGPNPISNRPGKERQTRKESVWYSCEKLFDLAFGFELLSSKTHAPFKKAEMRCQINSHERNPTGQRSRADGTVVI
ncbi:hypothetical protein OIU79_016715 [Salix purpurea]|uniref:Uncharacterized protein n=1 Tax=Salix purpurea TaxID=77065 RepID=A0A9Q0SRI2_SALPP|nr:hypothetical protein OIU79_016715 [Salix purpurea]